MTYILEYNSIYKEYYILYNMEKTGLNQTGLQSQNYTQPKRELEPEYGKVQGWDNLNDDSSQIGRVPSAEMADTENPQHTQNLVQQYNSYFKEPRLYVWSARTRYGSKVHVVDGSTSLCGEWTVFIATAEQVTCEKCLEIIQKRISHHTPNGEEKQKMETQTMTSGKTEEEIRERLNEIREHRGWCFEQALYSMVSDEDSKLLVAGWKEQSDLEIELKRLGAQN